MVGTITPFVGVGVGCINALWYPVDARAVNAVRVPMKCASPLRCPPTVSQFCSSGRADAVEKCTRPGGEL